MSSLVINHAGPQPVCETYLPKLATGEYIMGLAITERASGSYILPIATSAIRRDSGFVVNGEKMFVNNVSRVTYMLLAVRTTHLNLVAKKSEGFTLLIPNLRKEGLMMEELTRMGANYYKLAVMKIKDVYIGEVCVVGEVGNGWKALTHALNLNRMLYAALGIGSAVYAIKTAAAYAATRRVFGKPIGPY
jgi:acyl-CoA dehydrogenase